jgi:hypothetical protein
MLHVCQFPQDSNHCVNTAAWDSVLNYILTKVLNLRVRRQSLGNVQLRRWENWEGGSTGSVVLTLDLSEASPGRGFKPLNLRGKEKESSFSVLIFVLPSGRGKGAASSCFLTVFSI